MRHELFSSSQRNIGGGREIRGEGGKKKRRDIDVKEKRLPWANWGYPDLKQHALEKRDACCQVPKPRALVLRDALALLKVVCLGTGSTGELCRAAPGNTCPAEALALRGTGLQARSGGPGPGCCPAGAGGGRSRPGRSTGPREAGRLDSAVRAKLNAVLRPPRSSPPQPAAWPRSYSHSGPSRAAAPPAMATEESCAAYGSASSPGSEVPRAGRCGGVRRGQGWSGRFEMRSVFFFF